MMSELGSKGVEIEVTQPAWPTSSPRSIRVSAILGDSLPVLLFCASSSLQHGQWRLHRLIP